MNNPYHMLLGLPAIAKFMLNAHQPFLRMKLLGRHCVITMLGDYKKSLECSYVGSQLADSLGGTQERRHPHKVVVMAQAESKEPLPVSQSKRADDEGTFKDDQDNKKIAL